MKQTSGFEASMQKSQAWLAELCAELGWEDRHRAYEALRGTLHALRDRLPLQEAVHLGAQLPMVIRGLYYEGWVPSAKPRKATPAEFLVAVSNAFPPDVQPDPTEMVRAVFRVLHKHVTAGEMEDVTGALPRDFATLWMEPEPAEEGDRRT